MSFRPRIVALLACVCASLAYAAEPLLLPRPNAVELSAETFTATELTVSCESEVEFADGRASCRERVSSPV